MNNSNLSFPYPVLGLDGDFATGDFSLSPKIYTTKEALILDIGETLVITNDYICELYDSKFIELAIKINCSSTLFSKTFVGEKCITIDSSSIARSIEIEIFLITIKNIDNYTHASFNEDYFYGENNGIFTVNKGQVVGLLNSITIPISEEYLAGAKGIFKFVKTANKPINFDYDSKKIEIQYPGKEEDEDIDIVRILSSKYKMIFVNLFIIPALNFAFATLAKEFHGESFDEFVKENDWAYLLTKEFHLDIHNIDNPFSNAQKFASKLISKKTGSVDLPIFSTLNELK